MPLKPHPTDPDKMVYVSRQYDLPSQYSDIVSDGGMDPRNKFDKPEQRLWIGLTDEERDDLLDNYITAEGRARAIEAKLKEKNA